MNPNEYFVQLPKLNDYFASNHGRLLSTKRNPVSCLDGGVDSHGYHVYSISKRNNERISTTAQRMIANIFLPNYWQDVPDVRLETHHLDHNRLNNVWWDLALVTVRLHTYYNKLDKIYFFREGKFKDLNPYEIIRATGLSFE